MAGQWSIWINEDSKGNLTFDPYFPGAKSGQPLIVGQSDIVTWNNRTTKTLTLKPIQSIGIYLTEPIDSGQVSSPIFLATASVTYSCFDSNGKQVGPIHAILIPITITADSKGNPSFAPDPQGAGKGDLVVWQNTTDKAITLASIQPPGINLSSPIPPASVSNPPFKFVGNVTYSCVGSNGKPFGPTPAIRIPSPITIAEDAKGNLTFTPDPMKVKQGDLVVWYNMTSQTITLASIQPSGANLGIPIAAASMSTPPFNVAASVSYSCVDSNGKPVGPTHAISVAPPAQASVTTGKAKPQTT